MSDSRILPSRADQNDRLPPDPVVQAFKATLDRSLILRNLSLSVEERFRNLMQLQKFAVELRRAGAKARQVP